MNSASWFVTSWSYVVASAQRYLAGKYCMSEDDYKAYIMDLGVFDGVGVLNKPDLNKCKEEEMVTMEANVASPGKKRDKRISLCCVP